MCHFHPTLAKREQHFIKFKYLHWMILPVLYSSVNLDQLAMLGLPSPKAMYLKAVLELNISEGQFYVCFSFWGSIYHFI